MLPRHVPSADIRRSPTRRPFAGNFSLPRLPARMRTGWTELEQLRRALVRQLEKFMAERNQLVDEQPPPLAMLNRSRQVQRI
jgi:hypothetical protein